MKNTWSLILFSLALMGSSAALAKELQSRPLLRLATEMHFASVKNVSADAEGRYALTCSYDKTARLWDAGNGTLIRTFRAPAAEGDEGKLYACALSADGHTAALGGWSSEDSIYLFNTATGEMDQRLSGMGSSILDLEFHSDATLVASLGAGQGIRIFKKFGTQYALFKKDTAYGDHSYSLAFDNSGRLATACFDGYVRLYDNRFDLIKKKKITSGRRPISVAFSSDGRKLVVGHLNSATVEVLNGTSLDLLYRPDCQGAERTDMLLNKLSFGPHGHLFGGGLYNKQVGATWWRFVRRWDREGAGSFSDFKVVGNAVMDIVAIEDGSILVVGGLPDFGRYASNGNRIFYKRGETFDFSNKNRFDYFTVKQDGSAISFKPMDSKPFVFDIQNRELMQSDRRYLKYRDKNKGVALTNWKNSYVPKLNHRKMNLLKKYETCRSVDIGDDGTILVGADWYVYALDGSGRRKWHTDVPGAAWTVNIAGDGQTAVAAHNGGEIRWYRMKDGAVLLSLYVHPDGRRWILSTPDGYYDASPGADALLGWHINNGLDQAPDFFPVGKFAAKYYRPDVVARVLHYTDVNKALLAADRESKKKAVALDLQEMLPPVVTVLSPSDSTAISTSSVTLRYRVRSPSGEKVTGVKVFVDGRPIIKRGITVIPAEGVSKTTVEVPPRDCTVSIIAENRFTTSEPASVRLRWKGAEEFIVRPRLYVLAIGVSDYRDKSLSLAYAAKDARDFAAVVQRQKGLLYRDVAVTVLTDQAATRDNILDGLDWILRETTQKDIAMVFLAGHGLNDDYGRYYYMPRNTDTNKLRRTGVPYTDIKETVANIAGKAIFFIDTCHSGNVLGGNRRDAGDTTGIINELVSTENGVVVFASSTGRQYSLEDPKWGNGAFTKALVEGFSGKAAYKGSKITVNMLDLYISERVKKLTMGRQTPTTAKPRTIPDFPIAVIR